MEHRNPTQLAQKGTNKQYQLKDFIPLITIAVVILAYTLIKQYQHGSFNGMLFMRDFMAAFFIVFGGFKLLNLKGFAKAYHEYDLIAKKSSLYAYAYPFIEIGLGLSYAMGWYPRATNIITAVIMLISAAGVYNELRQHKLIACACLGTVFKIPMTYVTLAEDLLMGGMAVAMLILK